METNQLSAEQLVKLLKTAGSKHISEDMLQRDIDDGDFADANGNMKILDYLAWMIAND